MPESDAHGSRGQAIRNFLAKHPHAAAKTVAQALSAQGLQVSPTMVSLMRAKFGIITSLPEGPPPVVKRKPPGAKRAATVGAAEVKRVLAAIVRMTDAFCRDHLNDEYATLCRNLAGALARKRPSPLLRGQLETWACGIVRTIGWVNFLDDSSHKPHLKLPFIDRAFGVAESTGQGKSKLILLSAAAREGIRRSCEYSHPCRSTRWRGRRSSLSF